MFPHIFFSKLSLVNIFFNIELVQNLALTFPTYFFPIFFLFFLLFFPKLSNMLSMSQSSALVCSASPEHEPLMFKDVSRHSAWQQAMQYEIRTLHSNGTWTLVPYCSSINVVGSR
jgi:hypothetical protein